MKKTVFISVTALFLTITINAQNWQENVKHNGYTCALLKTPDNIIVYAAKGMIVEQECLFLKIRIPFDWGNQNLGNVGYFVENLTTGNMSSHNIRFEYYKGWLYILEILEGWCDNNQRRGDFPCKNITITLYENNDFGNIPGKKIVMDMCLNKLNTSKMLMNKQTFEKYW